MRKARHRSRRATPLASLAVAMLATAPAAASDLAVSPRAAVATGGNSVLLSVSVEHPEGASAIKVVAAEVTGGDAFSAFPALYDDGTHGDVASGDSVYSLQATLPGPAGEHAVVYYVVDAGNVELVTESATFTLE